MKEPIFMGAEHLLRVDSSTHAMIKRLICQRHCSERLCDAARAAGRRIPLVGGESSHRVTIDTLPDQGNRRDTLRVLALRHQD